LKLKQCLTSGDRVSKESLAEIKGKSLFGAHTAYGDGSYADEEGNIYPVQALVSQGLVGAFNPTKTILRRMYR
jgi:hypothetical protein